MAELIIIIVAVVVVVGGGGTTLLLRSRRSAPPSPPPPSTAPDRGVGQGGAATTASGPASATGTAERGEAGTAVPLEPDVAAPPARPAAPAEKPPPSAGRLIRLRSRLARSQSALGGALLGLLSSDRLDEQTWEEVEDTLITADMGVAPARQLVDELRTDVKVEGTRDPESVRSLLRRLLLEQVGADMDRTLHTARHGDRPAVVLVVGVNGTGKTTTVGKLARVLMGDGQTVLLGAADTFRAAAADQLQTWGDRVGAQTIRSDREGADPASVAFDAANAGIERGVDVVLGDRPARHGRGGAARPRRDDGPERPAPGSSVRRGRRRHRDRPHQAGRHGQGRDCDRRPARARRAGEAGRSRRGPRRSGSVRARGVRRRDRRRLAVSDITPYRTSRRIRAPAASRSGAAKPNFRIRLVTLRLLA